MPTSRVPEFNIATHANMKAWFKTMAERGLLFHPDDSPHQIVRVRTGRRTFSRDECRKLEGILSGMFNRFGDRVYTAAYPVFMRVFRSISKH